jgi:acetyltransferase
MTDNSSTLPSTFDGRTFFAPKGVAVVGASQDPTKLGYGLARNLVQSNYQGAVHFVNPKGGMLLGRAMYTNVLDVPDPVELAILLIPAPFVPQALQDCGRRGVPAVIIGSGGFRETGPEGAALEAQCLEIARAYGMRLIGPNCIGLLDTHLPMDATFLPPPGPLPGDVAFVSHSGAICAAVIDWARGHSFGLSRLVSLGNQTDVNETELLASIAQDPFTRVITLYLEGIGAGANDGRRFVAEARRITPKKPIIALKVGRFASGQRAVASHTGALAGQESAFNAAFRRAGVIRADDSEEMFDWARALAWCPPPHGRSVAVLTNAGGPGVTAADALEVNGLHLAKLSQPTLQALGDLLPPAASLHNPIDMLASASPEQYARSLQILLQDEQVHSVMVILPPPPMFAAGAVAKAMIPVIHNTSKPVVVALMGERLIQEAVEYFRAARVPEYRFPERAASALAVLVQRAEFLARVEDQLVECCQENRALLEPTVGAYLKTAAKGSYLPQAILQRLLQAYGIAFPPEGMACSAEEAAQIAEKIGMPVALKIASSQISHKTDVNGIVLNLQNPDEVRQGYEQVIENVRRALPAAHIDGVQVQGMIPGGQEVIVGAVQDHHFGALVMFGSGGVEVEGLKDIAFALAPMTQEEARHMLESTWAGRKLGGFRSLQPGDQAAVIAAIQRLAQLAADWPEIAEIEINPLRALPDGQGVWALDVRARC